MITILGRRNSSSVQLVMWAINEIGVDFERLDYGHGFKTTNTPAYLAMNPMGRVPVLQDGPVTMFESAAILRYLGAAYGSETFWPACPRSRASLDAIAEWGKNTFAEGVLRIFVYEVRMSAATRDPAFLAAAVENLIPLAKISFSPVSLKFPIEKSIYGQGVTSFVDVTVIIPFTVIQPLKDP